MELSERTLQQVLDCLPCAACVLDDRQRVVAHNRLATQQAALSLGDTLLPPVGSPAPAVEPLTSGAPCLRWTTTLPDRAGRAHEMALAAQHICVEGRRQLLVLLHEIPPAPGPDADLSQSEVRLRQAVHVAQLGIFEHDHLNDAVYFSPEHWALYGWGPELEPTLERIMAVVHPDDLQRVGAAIARAHDPSGDGVCDIEGRLLRPNGEIRWIHTRSQTFFGSVRGQLVPVRTVGASLDVTEPKEALERQQRLVSTLDATPDLVGIAELDGNLLYVNRAAREVFGLGEAASLAQIASQVGEGLRRQLTDVIVPCALRDGLWRGEVAMSTPAAGERPYSLIALAHGATGRSYMSFIAHDLSALRHLEEQARQSQKMEAIGRLAGGIAHDFNNLLSVILGYLDLAQAELPAEEPMAEYLRESLRAAERAAALTRQLLAFSRKQMLQPRVLDLGALLHDMQPMLRRLLGEDIALGINAGAELNIRADKSQLEQVVLNLVVNARDAMPEGGTITIDLRATHLDREASFQHGVAPGPFVMMTVADDGVGMDSATLARIFEPFFSTKGPGQGTGLGLATVFGVVKQNGGNIWAVSELGRGATFRLVFPQTDELPHVAPAASFAAASNSCQATILVVEDESQVRAMISTVLRGDGYVVIEAEDPLQAIERARAHAGPIDILLTDVVLPHFSGEKLARRLTQSRPELRVVYMSGYTEDAIVQRGVLDPNIHFLPKPITPGALRDSIQRVQRGTDGASQ